MKIIQMIYSLQSGGAEKFVVDLSNRLSELGHEVEVCMLRDDTEDKAVFNRQFLSPSVKVHSLKMARGFSFAKCRLVERYLKDRMPDVVHCHLNVIPYVYRFALQYRNIVFVHTLHNIASKTGGGNMQYYLNRFFYKHNFIYPVCISRLCQESYMSYYRLNNAPFIDNGRAFVCPSECFDKVRQEVSIYKKHTEDLVFVHIARCDEQKNQQLLVDAFNKLDKEGLNFVLLVIGNGYDSGLGKQLQSSACERIHFLGEKNNVNDYLMCSDAFCLTSHYEGLPITLLEALSCGVTPICTAVGGIPDVIKDGEYGYLSADQSVEAYCDAIRRFVATPILSEALVDYYKANYSMETCAAKYEALFAANLRK